MKYRKTGSISLEQMRNAYDLGGRQFVTFIQYGYFLNIDVEIHETSFNTEENMDLTGPARDVLYKIRKVLLGLSGHHYTHVAENIKTSIWNSFHYI